MIPWDESFCTVLLQGKVNRPSAQTEDPRDRRVGTWCVKGGVSENHRSVASTLLLQAYSQVPINRPHTLDPGLTQALHLSALIRSIVRT